MKLKTRQNWRFWCKNHSFWSIVGSRPDAAPRHGGRDKAAGIMSIWDNSPPRILKMHSLHQAATGTPHMFSFGAVILILFAFMTENSCLKPLLEGLSPPYGNSYNHRRHFLRFRNLLYDKSRLASNERLWSQFHILLMKFPFFVFFVPVSWVAKTQRR